MVVATQLHTTLFSNLQLSRKMEGGGSQPRKIEASLKMEEEGREIQNLTCPEDGCGFAADTLNMLLFHQGWSYSSFLELSRLFLP